MKIILLLLFVSFLFGSLNNAHEIKNETLKEQSSKALENFFISNSSDTISPVRFQKFLDKFSTEFINPKQEHSHSHNHSHSHTHDHDHDHEHNEHDDHEHNEQKDQTECFNKKILELKELLGKQTKLDPESFGLLSTIFVTSIDNCIHEKLPLNQTSADILSSNKESKRMVELKS